MKYHYILEGHEAVPCSAITWALWFQKNRDKRIVAQDSIGNVRISTVFLGLDHAMSEDVPLLFETMIFGGPHDQYQTRCTTWEQAVEMHKRALRLPKVEKS